MPGDQMQLMTMFIGRLTPEDEARWRAALNRLGPDGVRARLARTTSFGPDEMVEIGELMPLPTRQFVEAWLHRNERRQRRIDTWRFRITMLLALVAAVAAVIAATPIIKAWWVARL
jgi:hypothetical protein